MPDTDEADDVPPPTEVTDPDTLRLLQLLRGEGEAYVRDLDDARQLRRDAEELERRIRDRTTISSRLSRHFRLVEQAADTEDLDPDRAVTPIPEVDDPASEEVEFKTIREDRSYVRIVHDTDRNRYRYQAIEPALTRREQEALDFLRETLKQTLDRRREHQDWTEYLREAIDQTIVDHDVFVDRVGRARLQYYLERDFLGYGPIDVMMKDPMIEDLSCDGPGIPIYVFHRQYESMRSDVTFEDEDDLDAFVRNLAQRAGKHISIANPLLDATLPDTSRLQATLSREVTTRGSSFTVRRFRADPLTPPDLVRLGTLDARMVAYLWLGVEEGRSALFSGGTASGKTTTLNAAAQMIPPDQKIVSIEDTREINLEHENWIASLTRAGFGEGAAEGAGSVDMYDLLEAALRQRPEYILVGEVRGEEAQTLFQAMATGHATYSTLHADSVQSAVYRLENEPINVPRQMLASLDIVTVQTQTRIEHQLVRRLETVTEVTGIESGTGDLMTNRVFRWDPGSDGFEYLGHSEVIDEIRRRNNLSRSEIQREWERRAKVVEWMVEKGVRHIHDVWDVVAAYYEDPDALLDRIGRGEEE